MEELRFAKKQQWTIATAAMIFLPRYMLLDMVKV